MKRTAVLLAVGMLLVCGAQNSAFAACRVNLKGIVGDVESKANSKAAWVEAELDQCLAIGAKVRTGDDGKVILDYGEDTEIFLNSNAVLEVAREVPGNGDADQASLEKGELSATVKKGKGFSIKTPTAVAGVRGTEFDVEVDEEGLSDVYVTDGEVEVSNAQGKVRTRAGMMTRIRRGKNPDAPAKFDMVKHKAKMQAWKKHVVRGKLIRLKKKQAKEKIKQEIKEGNKEEVKEKIKEKVQERRERKDRRR